MKIKSYFVSLITLGLFFACQQKEAQQMPTAVLLDPLPSWNEGASKNAILDFVKRVTTAGTPDFVPVAERIATFDNDGTLWCEQPLYFEFVYSMLATKQIAAKVPALMKKPEIKALVDGDNATFLKSGEKGLLEAFAISHTAIGIDEFTASATMWLDTAVHKKFGKKYTELTYKPMVELLQYLRENQFKTFIVSGGSSMFIRTFSDKAYGIPMDQVVGTMFNGEFVVKDSTFTIVLRPELFHMDDNVGKPVAIYQFIGQKPILAFGNSDGDQQMLEWTSTNTHPTLSLLLHHTDSVREYAYDRNSSIGKLDNAWDEGLRKDWVIVDMKEDFGTVFSFQ